MNHMRVPSLLTLIALSIVTACFRPAEPHYACPSARSVGRQMGWVADPTSAMNESELRLASDVGKIAPPGGDRRWMTTASAGTRYSGDNFTVHADVNPAAVEGWDGRMTPGNLRLGLGLRALKTDLGGLYRRGLAIRAALGVDTRDDDDDQAISTEVSTTRPFEHLRFASGQSYEQIGEARYELVGCHAPYIHVQGGFRARKDADRSTYAAPFAVAVGAHPNGPRYWTRVPHTTVYVEYSGVIGRLPTTDSPIELAHRLRGGVVFDDVGISVNLDRHYGVGDGTVIGLTYALPLAWGR